VSRRRRRMGKRELGLEVDPTAMIGCTDLKEVEVSVNITFRKIYRIPAQVDITCNWLHLSLVGPTS
jgi:hypothetical protein